MSIRRPRARSSTPACGWTSGPRAAVPGRPGPLATRIEAFTEQSFRLWGYMHLHDPLAVGLAVDESLARWQTARIAVGEGGQTRRADGEPNCRVAKVIDGA